jgi:predicted nucleic acid-binding protein
MLDTSVWIDAFRGKTERVVKFVRSLLSHDRIITCGPVQYEIRQGLKNKESKKVLSLFDAIEIIPFAEEDWELAGRLSNMLRSKGHTLPVIDVLIGHICIKHKITLFTLDKHFQYIPQLDLLEF